MAIIIPSELTEILDRIRTLRSKMYRIRVGTMDPDRRSLLMALRKLKSPSELEQTLIDTITNEEIKFNESNNTQAAACKKECGELYEKVRQICKVLLLGKYVHHTTDNYLQYMRVTKVSMAPGDNGPTVRISGDSINFRRDTGLFHSMEPLEFPIVWCGTAGIPGSAHALLNLSIVSEQNILDSVNWYKTIMVSKCDSIIQYTSKLKDIPIPPDEPVDASKWW